MRRALAVLRQDLTPREIKAFFTSQAFKDFLATSPAAQATRAAADRAEAKRRALEQRWPAPGWYADPGGSGLRWWNGQAWTEHSTSSGWTDQPLRRRPPR